MTGILEQFEAVLHQDAAGRASWADRLCQAGVKVLPVEGAAVSVFLGLDACVAVGASDEDAARANDFQFATGEGPDREAYVSRRPVLVPDIRRSDSPAGWMWPTYTRKFTRNTSYQAVFALPMLVGNSALGVMNLYRSSLDDELDIGPATAICARITRDLLFGDPFSPTRGPETDPAWLDAPVARRRAVWTAQGMTMRAFGVTPRRTLDLLRAYALAVDRPLDEVADDIVSGRLVPRRRRAPADLPFSAIGLWSKDTQ